MARPKAPKRQMVLVPREEWEALVAFLRREEIVFQDSYSSPGKNDWKEYYKENHPAAYEIYDDAQRAASRKFKEPI